MSTSIRFRRFDRPMAAGVALVTLGLFGTGLSACGKKSSTSTTESKGSEATAASRTTAGTFPDVCKMFTNEEMGTLIDTTIVESKAHPQTKPDEPGCDWMDKNGGLLVTVSLAPKTKNAFADEFQGYEAVSGIGEGAFENHGILSVLHRTTEITVIFGGGGSEETQKKVATQVIQKLDSPAGAPSK